MEHKVEHKVHKVVELVDMAHMVEHMEVALEHMVAEVQDMAMEDMMGHKMMVDMAGIDCSCRSSRVKMNEHLECKKQTRESMTPS